MTAATCQPRSPLPLTTRIVAGRRLESHVEQRRAAGAILVATDGEPESAGAVRCAVQLSRHTGTPLQVLAVVEPHALRFDTDKTRALAVDSLQEREGKLHQRVLDQLREVFGDEAVGINMHYGRVAPVIAEVSRAWRVAMIVIGVGDRGPASTASTSDTTLRVAAAAPVPTLAVAPGCVAPAMTIVVATDFSEASNRAAHAATRVAPDGAEIILVHVNPFLEMEARDRRGWHGVYLAGVQSLFAELSAQLQAMNDRVTIRQVLLEGSAAERIVEISALLGADLVVAGRHAPPAIRGEQVHGMIATLIRDATCSVLVSP